MMHSVGVLGLLLMLRVVNCGGFQRLEAGTELEQRVGGVVFNRVQVIEFVIFVYHAGVVVVECGTMLLLLLLLLHMMVVLRLLCMLVLLV